MRARLMLVLLWLQITHNRRLLQMRLLYQHGRGNWQRNESNELKSMAYKHPTKKTSPRHLQRCRNGKGNSPREENVGKCRQPEFSPINATGLQKLPNGSGDWRTRDVLNRSWFREGRRKILQIRSRVL